LGDSRLVCDRGQRNRGEQANPIHFFLRSSFFVFV
jgi:hypothetical protein